MPTWRFLALVQGLSAQALWRVVARPKAPLLEGDAAELYFATM